MTGTPGTPHHCEFPVLPPHSIMTSGPCDCGRTYLASIAEQRAAEAGLVAVRPEVLAEAGEVARLEAELSRVQSGAHTLGRIITRLGQSMEAARIEMIQNGPEAAMQWILNSLPDVSDEAPEDQWDGKETATQWIDRIQAAGRAVKP
jgi:hypothetical protein